MFRNSLLFKRLLNRTPCLSSYSISGTTITLSDPADFSTNVWAVRTQIITNGITKVIVTAESGDYNAATIPWNLIEEVDIQRKSNSVFSINFDSSKILKKVSLGTGAKIISGKAFSRTSISEIDLSYVTGIDSAAFEYCHNIVSLSLPNVQDIPDNFAHGCSNLQTVDISGATYIHTNAFANCSSLATINLSSSVIYILDYAFGLTNINSLTFPSTLQRIGFGAFAFSSLSNVTFSKSSTTLYLEAHCFEGTKLQSIEFPSNVNWDMNKGEGFVNGTNSLTKIVINSNYVPKSFARDCIALKSVVATNAQYILNNAFYNCKSLATITLPTTFNQIADYAFAYCESLVLNIPQTSLSIGNYSFAYCSSLNFSVVPSTWTLGKYAFIGCTNITLLNIQADISKSNGLFQGCTKLTTLTIKSQKVPIYCFANCSSLKTVTFAQNQIYLDSYSFASTGPIENLSLTTVSGYSYAFQYSNLVSVTIRGNTNAQLAFLGCMNLKTITLSKDSTWMDATMAINTSKSLQIIPDKENGAFQVKDNMVTAYSNLFALLPTYSSSTFSVPAGILYLNRGFLALNPKVTKIIIDNDGLRIQSQAFIYSWAVKKITINKCKNKDLSAKMFQNDYSLEEVSFPSKITQIGESCFYNNYNLKKVTFAGTITAVGSRAFYGCYLLENFDYSNVRQIPTECFRYCYKLKSVSFSDSLRKIDTYAFDNSGISTVSIPDSCFYIGDYSFANCANLKQFTIGKGITRLPPYLVANSPISSLSIPSSVKYINANTFSGALKLSVDVDDANPYFISKNQAIYSKLTNTLICTYGSLPELYEIPDVIEVIPKGALQTNMETVQSPVGSFYTGVSAARLVIPSSMKIIDTTSIGKMFTTCYSGKYFLFNGQTIHGYTGDAYHNPFIFGAEIDNGKCEDGDLPSEYTWTATLTKRSYIGLIIALVLLIIIFLVLVAVYLFFPIRLGHNSDPDRSIQNESINLV